MCLFIGEPKPFIPIHEDKGVAAESSSAVANFGLVVSFFLARNACLFIEEPRSFLSIHENKSVAADAAVSMVQSDFGWL